MIQSDKNIDWAEITLTHRCNQRCFFCYEDGRDIAKEPDMESVKALLRATRKQADQVVLCGKEVLLRRDVLDIIRYAASLGLIVVVFTNGQALARQGLIEQLVEAGTNSISVSFHFPDPQVFARASRTTERGFFQIIKGLNNFRKYKEQHPNAQISISTETDMFSLNSGRLHEMRDTLMDVLGRKDWRMRLGCLLPSKTHDIGLNSVLEPMTERREEIKHFIETHPGEIPLRFVKTPLCLIPGFEHLALETEYLYQGTLLTFNHSDADQITIDPYSTSINRDIITPLNRHPYRWLCRTCNLLPMCRFERVEWGNISFPPSRSQKPQPEIQSTPHDILARIGSGTKAQSCLKQCEELVAANSFPEESIIAALTHQQDSTPVLVGVHTDHGAILVVELSDNGYTLEIRLSLAGQLQKDLIIFDYLSMTPVNAEKIPTETIHACYRTIASLDLPDISSWENTPLFDNGATEFFRYAWQHFGERLWPGFGAIKKWKTAEVSLECKNRLLIKLLHPSSTEALLTVELNHPGSDSFVQISITLFSRKNDKISVWDEYCSLLLEIGTLHTGQSPNIDLGDEQDIFSGKLSGVLEQNTWRFHPTTDTLLPRGKIRFSVKDQAAEAGECLFFISPIIMSQPHCKQVGSLMLSYNQERLSSSGKIFMQILFTAMEILEKRSLPPSSIKGWHKTVTLLLQRAGLADKYTWRSDYCDEWLV